MPRRDKYWPTKQGSVLSTRSQLRCVADTTQLTQSTAGVDEPNDHSMTTSTADVASPLPLMITSATDSSPPQRKQQHRQVKKAVAFAICSQKGTAKVVDALDVRMTTCTDGLPFLPSPVLMSATDSPSPHSYQQRRAVKSSLGLRRYADAQEMVRNRKRLRLAGASHSDTKAGAPPSSTFVLCDSDSDILSDDDTTQAPTDMSILSLPDGSVGEVTPDPHIAMDTDVSYMCNLIDGDDVNSLPLTRRKYGKRSRIVSEDEQVAPVSVDMHDVLQSSDHNCEVTVIDVSQPKRLRPLRAATQAENRQKHMTKDDYLGGNPFPKPKARRRSAPKSRQPPDSSDSSDSSGCTSVSTDPEASPEEISDDEEKVKVICADVKGQINTLAAIEGLISCGFPGIATDGRSAGESKLGPRIYVCRSCKALHYKGERTKGSTEDNPVFTSCCRDGKILLAPIPYPVVYWQKLMLGLEGDFNAYQAQKLLTVTFSPKQISSGKFLLFLNGKIYHSLVPLNGDKQVTFSENPLRFIAEHPYSRDVIFEEQNITCPIVKCQTEYYSRDVIHKPF